MLYEITDPRLEKLQRILVESVFEPEIMPEALRLFASFCGAEVGHLMVADGNRTLLQSTFSIDLDSELIALEAMTQDINPRVLAIPNMKPMKSTRDKDFISWDAMQKDPLYQDLFIPLGLGHFSAVPIVNSPSLTSGIALHRPIAGEAFNDDEAYRHEVAAAVCAPVFHLASIVEKNQAKSALHLFGEAKAAAIVAMNGAHIEHNREFDRLIEKGVVKITPERMVRFNSSASNDKFRRTLNKHTKIIGGNFVTKDHLGRAEFMVSILPVPKIGIVGQFAASAVVTLKPIQKSRQLNLKLAKEAFGFTTAEAETAKLLIQGKSVKQIDAARNVSSNTTQTLIKRIFVKTECHRQTEVVALLSHFCE